MTPLPVPCPLCGGLVDRTTLKCAACGCTWPSVLELELDGALAAAERAYTIAGTLDETPAGDPAWQPVWDAVALEKRYVMEREREEKRR